VTRMFFCSVWVIGLADPFRQIEASLQTGFR